MNILNVVQIGLQICILLMCVFMFQIYVLNKLQEVGILLKWDKIHSYIKIQQFRNYKRF
jgi:hypothetical protein